ncbi:MAG: hypothetical protein OCU12_06185 [Methanophagales archaeon]|nr:hypothetical protein [Methanophagales archaeon]
MNEKDEIARLRAEVADLCRQRGALIAAKNEAREKAKLLEDALKDAFVFVKSGMAGNVAGREVLLCNMRKALEDAGWAIHLAQGDGGPRVDFERFDPDEYDEQNEDWADDISSQTYPWRA